MRKGTLYAILFVSALSFTSCDLFQFDNYDAPNETILGEVVDVATGEPVLTDQGSEGIRVRMTETQWGNNVEHSPDFFCMPDGKFRNTKVFKGEYKITVDGPFIPIVREGSDGIMIADDRQTLMIKGTKSVTFEVQPFLKVEIIGIPTVSNGKVNAKVKVTRAVSMDDFREKIQPMLGAEYSDNLANVTDIQFFVSYSSSVGYRARDERWSNKIEYAGGDFNNKFGTNINISSSKVIPSGRTVFVRAAARINLATPIKEGVRRWNYSEPIEVIIP